jgi:hypothetical protein
MSDLRSCLLKHIGTTGHWTQQRLHLIERCRALTHASMQHVASSMAATEGSPGLLELRRLGVQEQHGADVPHPRQ